ncbi:MAG TPA: serine hydrolase domain-containing protein [Acidimicrobiales bacterium]|nr:serine hydrolase domain-containing protein [Acidimicrobiales bacterium]
MKIDADAAGMDAARLQRIDQHLQTHYVGPGKIAGCQVLVARHGAVAHLSSLGERDRERARPVGDDTIWRLFSMSKPVTGVALLTLYERGLFRLDDPVHRFIPAWRDLKVRDGDQLVRPQRPMTVRDLMMHMSGLGYTLDNRDLDVAMLRRPPATRLGEGGTLETMVDRLSEAPLRFHPGTQWLYSFATDVCGRLVEVLSGQRFDDYLRTTIFEPLGMADTGFTVPDDKIGRFAASYTRNARKELELLEDPESSHYRGEVTFLSGGAGLVATSADYLRFCRMLLNGGELDGVRVLSRKTVELMRSNHLPGDRTLADVALPGGYGEVGFEGMGFGLTVAVSLGPVATHAVGSAGEFMWGGAASTLFWIDPAEDLVVVFMTQLIPSGTFNFRAQLKQLVYGAIAD